MKFNLLFIDDEKDILNAYESLIGNDERSNFSKVDNLLEEFGINNDKKEIYNDNYRFFSASQGKEGVAIVEEQQRSRDPINVCFVDFRMPPGINGKETIKLIREVDKDVEIVLVTAYSDIDLEEIVNYVGTPEKTLFLKKPFDNKEVRQLILNLTRKYFDSKVRESFISNVTHELKTPLASILGYSQLLLEDELSEEQKKFLNVILDNALLMNEQVEDLLSTAQMADKKLKLNKGQISSKNISNEIKLTMSPLFKTKEVSLRVECRDSFNFFADLNKIKQCLINLLTNSRKFTSNGVVSLLFYKEAGKGVMEVSDTGIGIAEKNLKNIFEKFYRVENEHHNTPGLGIGLSIVKKIIDAHGMQVEVSSELEKGTKFKIWINEIESKEIAA